MRAERRRLSFEAAVRRRGLRCAKLWADSRFRAVKRLTNALYHSEEKDAEKQKKKDAADDEAASTLPSKEFEGEWKAEGEYEIKYTAEKAGDYELHLWCDVEGNGQRQKLPGSPFPLNVVANKASAFLTASYRM